jgi:hypothetical protein
VLDPPHRCCGPVLAATAAAGTTFWTGFVPLSSCLEVLCSVPYPNPIPHPIYSALRPLQSTRKGLPLNFQPNLFLLKPVATLPPDLSPLRNRLGLVSTISSFVLSVVWFQVHDRFACILSHLRTFLLYRAIARCHLVYCTVTVSELSTIEDAAQSTAVASLVWSSSYLVS